LLPNHPFDKTFKSYRVKELMTDVNKWVLAVGLFGEEQKQQHEVRLIIVYVCSCQCSMSIYRLSAIDPIPLTRSDDDD